MNDFKYVGSELDLFANVTNWKSYWSDQIRPYLRGDVLEVGAGLGANTRFLSPSGSGRSVCLEPDAQLVLQLQQQLPAPSSARTYEAVCGTLQDITGQFDTLVYIDVLEHIPDDAEEMKRAAALLRPGGHLVILSPAHQFLYTPFDKAIGHFRRYNKPMLRALTPPSLSLERLWYLDTVGTLASLGNLLFLQRSQPNSAQLQVWDKWMIPISRLVDPLTLHYIGKSIIGVWRKQT